MGSISERSTSSSSSSSSKKIDPLLRDLNDKKQIFRRNVVSLAAELKEVRAHLALQQQSVAKETQKRQEAEANAKGMEEKVVNLHRILEEKDKELQGYSSSAEKYVKELDDLRTQLTVTKSTAEASAASAQSAKMKCLALVKDLDDQNNSIKDHEDLVKNLAEQLVELQKDLQARESSQKQLKDEVLRVERDIMEAMAKAGENKDCELRKILDEISPKNIEKMNRLLSAKDEEISKLRDEIRILSAQWKLKTKELQNQLEKHRKADQELKKRVLKLEFCLQEARSQTRKLLRMGERGDKAIKELQEELATMQHQSATASGEKHNFWGSSHFKIIASSMSMLILVMFTKRATNDKVAEKLNLLALNHQLEGNKVHQLQVHLKLGSLCLTWKVKIHSCCKELNKKGN